MPRGVRASRATETRNATQRKAQYRQMPQAIQESPLYIPPHIIPDDMEYSWVRIAVHNQPDHNNWSTKAGKGWRPVPMDRHPDVFPPIPAMPGMESPGNIIMRGSGLVLCERRKADVQRDRNRTRQTNRDAIEKIKFTGQDAPTNSLMPPIDRGSAVNIEQVVARPLQPGERDANEGGQEFK